jgi:hypothetical protein
MANKHESSAKNITGDFAEFTDVMRRLMAVPHSEVKAKLEAEKRAKKRKNRFPRFWREGFLVNRPRLLPRQFSIGQPLAGYVDHCGHKAVCVVQRVIFRGPVVIAKTLLVKIAE